MALEAIPRACATVSIGTLFLETGNPPLQDKITAIADAGFQGIELALWDLQPFASHLLGKDVGLEDYEDLVVAGREVRKLCKARQLKVVLLVACFRIEGWPRQSKEQRRAFDTIRQTKKIMQAVNTDTLLLAATDANDITPTKDDLVADLATVADILAEDDYKFAYESICWATVAPTWKSGWELIKKVDRDNVGLCLDTFHIAGYEWADPSTTGAIREEPGLEDKFRESLLELTQTIPPEKIFLLQIGDAYRFPRPILATHNVKPREEWARNSRPFPCGHGGFLPVVQVMEAVLKTGYRSWCSIEVFDGGPAGDTPRKDGAHKNGQDAMASYLDSMRQVKL